MSCLKRSAAGCSFLWYERVVGFELLHGNEHKWTLVHMRVWQDEPWGIDAHAVDVDDVDVDKAVAVAAVVVSMGRGGAQSLLYLLCGAKHIHRVETAYGGYHHAPVSKGVWRLKAPGRRYDIVAEGEPCRGQGACYHGYGAADDGSRVAEV